MNIEKMQEILADEAFVKTLLELESVTEVQAALQEKGVELTEEQILFIRESLIKVESGEISAEQLESGELPEELLEQVAGGLIPFGIFAVIAIAVSIGVGVGVNDAIRRRW